MTATGHERSPGQANLCIVGCGIMGASIAYHAARHGFGVTLVERGSGPACEVTGDTFGWLNTINGAPAADPDLFTMRLQALEHHRALQRRFSRLQLYRWNGALVWRQDAGATEALFHIHRDFSEETAVQLVDGARAGALEPGLRVIPPCAVWCPREGTLDAIGLTQALTAAAVENGASFHAGRLARRVLVRGDRAVGVATDSGDIEADVTILAAGSAIPDLAASAGACVPLEGSPAILMTFSLEGTVIDRVVSCPTLEARGGAKDRLVVAEDYPGPSMSFRPDEIQAQTATEITRILAVAAAFPKTMAIGNRPMPVNGKPLLGYVAGCTGLYAAAADPGVILAPLLGAKAVQDLSGA